MIATRLDEKASVLRPAEQLDALRGGASVDAQRIPPTADPPAEVVDQQAHIEGVRRPLDNKPVHPAEVLIKEARQRQRRRWTFSVVALLASVGLVAGLVNASGGPPPPRRAGNGSTIASAFLARAEKGFSGRLLLRYAVRYGTGPRAVRGSVVVAQVSKTHWAYFSTPSVTDLLATGSNSSVFANPVGEPVGEYHCARTAATSPWSCSNFSTAEMGGRAELLGPYPPSALIEGLQNAIVDYSGALTGARVTPEPAPLVVREVNARKSSCLAFGKPAHPVAFVCLDAANVVSSYDVPIAGSYYSEAELRSYSRNVANTRLALPTRPSAGR